MNKTNFWDKSRGTFPILMEGTKENLISFFVNQNKDEKDFEINFNPEGTSFYIRTEKFAIRISQHWGECGECQWDLDRCPNTNLYQAVKINYADLVENN